MAVIVYKCPNCGAEIKFNPELQKGKCDFCLSEFTVDEIDRLNGLDNQHINKENLEQNYNKEWDNIGEKTRVYSCPRCGAEIVADNTTTATFCCYCHGPVVLSDKFNGEFKPSKVIPFKIDKDKAIENFINWSKKKWFLPSEFSSSKQLEKITGIYIPFWIVDSNVTGQMSARGKKIKTWVSGDYKYTKTDIYNIYREANLIFKNVPSNASSKMDDKIMESIEPYDSREFKEFSIAYLPGFFSEKYDKTKEQVLPLIESKIRLGTNDILRNSINGYSIVDVVGTHENFNKTSCNYALMPVWMMTYSLGSKNYIFAMNGQTGKVFGALPVSKVKIFILFLLVFIIVFLLVFIGGMTI
ncbi:hypothetical protein [Clostridium cuniculi]|uniref:hypothetical protein n=1 Tax=Clostridium cuniculi TaxID=2548455 RepID=UPI0010564E26|nr:hypothetical protein [Clostridium cuniculi]